MGKKFIEQNKNLVDAEIPLIEFVMSGRSHPF